jgi:hypothetical protein
MRVETRLQGLETLAGLRCRDENRSGTGKISMFPVDICCHVAL